MGHKAPPRSLGGPASRARKAEVELLEPRGLDVTVRKHLNGPALTKSRASLAAGGQGLSSPPSLLPIAGLGYIRMGFEIDFLPVGKGETSGDAIAIRFGDLLSNPPRQVVVVIDGGFERSGAALVEHIRTHYHTNAVNLLVSTHPDKDHVNGLRVVLREMKVYRLWMHRPWLHAGPISLLCEDRRTTPTSLRKALCEDLEAAYELEQDALETLPADKIQEPFAGAWLTWPVIAEGRLTVLGPTQDYYENLLTDFTSVPAPPPSLKSLLDGLYGARPTPLGLPPLPRATVRETWHRETLPDPSVTSAENNSGTILLLQTHGRDFLFTADVGAEALNRAIDFALAEKLPRGPLSFVQLPHHGSHHNINRHVFDRLLGKPLSAPPAATSAVVFVSASKDAPKHPSKRVVNCAIRRGARVIATKGSTKYHHRDSPDRGWTTAVPLAFSEDVTDDDE